MNDDSNPLSNFNDAGDGLDMDEWEFYGEDPSGPLPFEESNNNVVVSPVEFPFITEIEESLLREFRMDGEPASLGVDVYLETLKYVEQQFCLYNE